MQYRTFTICRLSVFDLTTEELSLMSTNKLFIKWNALTACGTTFPAKMAAHTATWNQPFTFAFNTESSVAKIQFSVREVRDERSPNPSPQTSPLTSPRGGGGTSVGECHVFTSDVKTIHETTVSLVLPMTLSFRGENFRGVLQVDIRTDRACNDVVVRIPPPLGNTIRCSVSGLFFPSVTATNIVVLQNTSLDTPTSVILKVSSPDLLTAVPDTFVLRPGGSAVTNVSLRAVGQIEFSDVASDLFLTIHSPSETKTIDVILDHPSVSSQQSGFYHYVMGGGVCCRNTPSSGDVACRISPNIIHGLIPSKSVGYTVSARCVSKNWSLSDRVQSPPAVVDESGVCLVHGTSFVLQRSAMVMSDDSGQVEFSVCEGKTCVVAVGLLHIPLGGVQKDSVVVYLHVLPTYAEFDAITSVVAKLHCTWSYA